MHWYQVLERVLRFMPRKGDLPSNPVNEERDPNISYMSLNKGSC